MWTLDIEKFQTRSAPANMRKRSGTTVKYAKPGQIYDVFCSGIECQDNILAASHSVATGKNDIVIWSNDFSKYDILRGHTNRVEHCQFSRDGLILVSVACDKLCIIWDVHSGKKLVSFCPCPNDATTVSYPAHCSVSHDRKLVSLRMLQTLHDEKLVEGTLQVWEIDYEGSSASLRHQLVGAARKTFRDTQRMGSQFTWSKNDEWLLFSTDGRIRVLALDSGKWAWTSDDERFSTYAFMSDGKQIAMVPRAKKVPTAFLYPFLILINYRFIGIAVA
jgi:WD40 repeat protein